MCNNLDQMRSLVYTYFIPGSWDVDNCNRLQGVICKRGINSSYDFASTEATTIMPGNCEDGWYNLGKFRNVHIIAIYFF